VVSLSLTLFSKNPVYAGVKLFNCLPLTLRETSPFSVLKSQLYKYLVSNSFYSVDEFISLKWNTWMVLCIFRWMTCSTHSPHVLEPIKYY
jgi:hypothetical protein